MDTTAEKMRVGVLKLFVYGTLKRGCRNHDHYCGGATDIRNAEIRGRLYEGPGFPVLEVPGEDVLARGTADPVADAATQARLSRRTGRYLRPVPERAVADGWGVVCGELLTFDDPEARLPAIDRLEGFRPDGHSLYRRVLVPATGESAGEVVWVYTIEATQIKGRRIASGRWPEVAR